jgi:hypothetical protein
MRDDLLIQPNSTIIHSFGGVQGRACARGEGGGRRLAWRGAARRACRSQAGGKRGKEERKGRRKRKREKKEKGKRRRRERESRVGADLNGDRCRSATRARHSHEEKRGIASALIAERRSRVVIGPPSGAGWDRGRARVGCQDGGENGEG